MIASILKWDPNTENVQKNAPLFQALDRKTTQLNRKQISGLAFHLIFHRFSPFNCCLSVIL